MSDLWTALAQAQAMVVEADQARAKEVIEEGRRTLTAAGLVFVPVEYSVDDARGFLRTRYLLRRGREQLELKSEAPLSGTPLEAAVEDAKTRDLAYMLRGLVLLAHLHPSDQELSVEECRAEIARLVEELGPDAPHRTPATLKGARNYVRELRRLEAAARAVRTTHPPQADPARDGRQDATPSRAGHPASSDEGVDAPSPDDSPERMELREALAEIARLSTLTEAIRVWRAELPLLVNIPKDKEAACLPKARGLLRRFRLREEIRLRVAELRALGGSCMDAPKHPAQMTLRTLENRLEEVTQRLDELIAQRAARGAS